MSRQTVVKPGKTTRQMLRLNLAQALWAVRRIRSNLRQRASTMDSLTTGELDHWVAAEAVATKYAANLRAQLAKMG